MPSSLIALTRRSCNVPLARSTRPLACGEWAQMISMLSFSSARPKWVSADGTRPCWVGWFIRTAGSKEALRVH